MPIYTIDDLRKTAPADLQELDDVDLVREYSRKTGKQFEQVADYLGVKIDNTDVQALLDEITSLRQELLSTQQTITSLTKT